MKSNRKIIPIIFLFLFIINNGFSQSLSNRLEELSTNYQFTFEPLRTDTFFTEKYLIKLEQPIDQRHPDGETFIQRIYLAHYDFGSPVVLITEGYTASYAGHPRYVNELSEILKANQICVEHRYFGESVPRPLNWEYLNIYNAAADHHKVVEILKNIYRGSWVNTGISKGGQTMMYHRFFYPDDVSASIGYVCPLNFSIADKRTKMFFKRVGDSICRNKILDYQTEMLKNKSIYIPEFMKLADEKKLTYKMGILQAYELTVFEYSFAFWQWGVTPCDSVPVDPLSPRQMVRHLDDVAGIDWVSDAGVRRFEPFYYQALTEIGFYGYDIGPFENYVSFLSDPDFSFTAPQGVEVKYDPVPMEKVDAFIRHQAQNMIFLYGEDDPWSSTGVDLSYQTNSIKIVKPGGSHLTRIKNLLPDQQKIVIDSLKSWLNIK
ncbi:MAG: aminopeptidase [Bacteroidales bacterium]|nr:aminopeptidase [Bacteroidales bacterium]